MINYLPVILICSLSYEDAECREGWKDVTIITGEVKNTPTACLVEGYERLSHSAYAPRAEDGYYVKVKCVPTHKEYVP